MGFYHYFLFDLNDLDCPWSINTAFKSYIQNNNSIDKDILAAVDGQFVDAFFISYLLEWMAISPIQNK